MPLETHTRCWHDDHSTSSSEGSEDPDSKYNKHIQTENLHKIISLCQNSNPGKIDCKIPIILEKELIQTYNFNPDVTFLEIIIEGLKNHRTHGERDLDELLRNEPSKNLVLDGMEAVQKVRMQPKFQSNLRSASVVSNSDSTTESQTVAYSNTNSSLSSYQSRSSTNSASLCTSTDTGLLHWVWHNGSPHFQFSIEGLDKSFVANPTKVKSENNLSMDFIYLFHEVENAKKQSPSRFLGNMRVSSTYVVNPTESTCIETQFVLFGSKEDYDQEMLNPSTLLVKHKGFVRKFAEKLKPSLSPLPRYIHKTSKTMLCETSLIEGEISGNKQSGSTSSIFFGNFPTNHELATIIIRDSENSIMKKEPVIGGWGLKFLQKIETRKNGPSNKKIIVLVPKGFHGGPAEATGGPTSLRERWSSGTCDCGGWDSGCPITVFSNRNGSNGSPHDEMQESGSENLFIEGVRHDEPTLKLVIVGENVFMVHFQSNLSVLQCFSIAVAIVHSRIPDLHPKI